MTRAHHFLMHTRFGRVAVVDLFLAVSLLVAILAGCMAPVVAPSKPARLDGVTIQPVDVHLLGNEPARDSGQEDPLGTQDRLTD